jgi:hypothetical protein
MRQFEEEGSELTPRGEESGRAEKGDVLVGRSGRRRSIAWLYEAPSASDSGRRALAVIDVLAGTAMRCEDDRAAQSPSRSPCVLRARSSCPQCGRGDRSNGRIVFGCHVVLDRRPQCGQQLEPSPWLGFVRACSDDLKIEFRRSGIRTRSQVSNRPRNRGRPIEWQYLGLRDQLLNGAQPKPQRSANLHMRDASLVRPLVQSGGLQPQHGCRIANIE